MHVGAEAPRPEDVGPAELAAGLGRELGVWAEWLAARRGLVRLLLVGLVLYALAVNAWVSEDAYFSLRSVEQLLAGHGPRWNPDERVQAYTHPLWFWLLALARLVVPHPFFAALVLGATCSLAALWLLYRDVCDARGAIVGGLAVVTFLSSKSLVDYTTSGLESSLSYLLLLASLVAARRALHESTLAASVGASACIFLLATNRLDTLVLTAPLLFLVWRGRARTAGEVRAFTAVALASVPLAASLCFSLFYYGLLLPNTAYAKLLPLAGSRWHALRDGVEYGLVSAAFDPLLAVLVGVGGWMCWRSGSRYWRAIGLGIALNLAYVVWVGGDFMSGRFLTLAALAGLFALAHRIEPAGVARLTLFLLVFVLSPLHPLHPFSDRHGGAPTLGVADERAFYSDHLSLEACTVALLGTGECPDHPWYVEGEEFAGSRDRVAVTRNAGLFGFRAGLDKTVVDELGLADPLLARLPSREPGHSRTGHVVRWIPPGYLDGLETGENRVREPHLHEYYDKVRVLTRAPLLAPGRLETIVRFNLGLYDHLLAAGLPDGPIAGGAT